MAQMPSLKQHVDQAVRQGNIVEVTVVDRDSSLYGYVTSPDGTKTEQLVTFSNCLPDVQAIVLGQHAGRWFRFPSLGGVIFDLLHIYKPATQARAAAYMSQPGTYAKAISPPVVKAQRVINDWPHICPRCKGPGYEGFNVRVECKNKCGG